MDASPGAVLVVDDNAANLKLARVILVNEGYLVRTAVDAEEALALLESWCPDLILMDIQLPGLDGLALTRRLKADPRFSGVLIVALTAYAMPSDHERVYAAGCDGYISKPIDIVELPRTVAAHLRGRRRP